MASWSFETREQNIQRSSHCMRIGIGSRGKHKASSRCSFASSKKPVLPAKKNRGFTEIRHVTSQRDILYVPHVHNSQQQENTKNCLFLFSFKIIRKQQRSESFSFSFSRENQGSSFENCGIGRDEQQTSAAKAAAFGFEDGGNYSCHSMSLRG